MNLQIETRPNKPLVGVDPLNAVAPECAQRVMPTEPSETDAYGCVEWFNYEKHPLSATVHVKAKEITEAKARLGTN
jgi:hypothetical protein